MEIQRLYDYFKSIYTYDRTLVQTSSASSFSCESCTVLSFSSCQACLSFSISCRWSCTLRSISCSVDTQHTFRAITGVIQKGLMSLRWCRLTLLRSLLLSLELEFLEDLTLLLTLRHQLQVHPRLYGFIVGCLWQPAKEGGEWVLKQYLNQHNRHTNTNLQFRWCQVASIDHLEDIIADALSSGGELGVAVQ